MDVPLPSEDVFSDVQRLVNNLVGMNEILRDREHTSIRLVMNPDRMVIREAQRMGYREIRLDTLPSMTRAIGLYRKFGFEPMDAYYETPVSGTIFLRRILA